MDVSGPLVEVDVAGVRYEVLVPAFLWPEIQALTGEDSEGMPDLGLHVFYHATTNQPVPVLVGFLRRAERDFFRKFVAVEGIGPSKAVKAMNVSVSTIARAIEQEERAVLTRLPGIGTRGADKIIATLRGKVLAEAALHDGGIDSPVDITRTEEKRLTADAVEALVGLGYSRPEARRWVEETRDADPGLRSLEELTLAVLRRMDQR
jgi:Holliday junction DNA helicase RuvA